MTDPWFAIRLAWRDTWASWRRLTLLVAAVMAGVAALVAINSFTDNLRHSVAEQAEALLGADLVFSARAELDTNVVVTALVDSISRAGGRDVTVARSVSLAAMAYLPRHGTARLIQLRSVDTGWPFHGEIVTSPAGVWSRLQEGQAIVDPSLLTSLDAAVGDTITVGEGRFPVVGTVVTVPGEVGLQSAFGARVYIATSRLPSTGLLGFGARAEHEIALRLPATLGAQPIADANRPALREARVRVRTVADDRDTLTNALTRLGRYLGLVALVALLLGGLGTASAVHVLIKQRMQAIAVLRCLGATSRQILLAYLLQALCLGFVGAVLGAAIGVGMQQAMPTLFRDLVPVDVQLFVSLPAIGLGIALGCWTALIFAVLPLLAIRDVPPLATLRPSAGRNASRRDPARIGALLAVMASVVALAAIQVGSLRQGAWFALGGGVALLVLWLTALLTIVVARRVSPRRSPYLVRQGLANLHRPANQTVTVVLSLGFGAFLLTTLFTAQANLLREFRIGGEGPQANMVFIDVQPDQIPILDDALRAEGIAPISTTPIVNMRLLEVDGVTVSKILVEGGGAGSPDGEASDSSTERGGLWAFRREYRSTYRDALGPSERVVAGAWFDGTDTATGQTAAAPAPISVEQDLAKELGVGLGSRLTWDIQGLTLHTVVRSLRSVNWARFEPNFFVIFTGAALGRAPQTSVTLASIPDAGARGRVQRQLAERAANVTSVDLGELQQALETVIARVVSAIRFMAIFSLVTGVIVLVGAIATSRWQRIREGTLLRTLGATRGQVLTILSVEYVALGLAAALVATGLATVAGWSLARWVFQTGFVLPWAPMLALAGGLVSLTLVVGLWSSLDVLRRPPLAVLRND
ncbi:MAG: FtsX-like permease family protein [Gemmatimonadota bacterium]